MAFTSLEQQGEGQTDRHPLLMEQPVNHNGDEHVIDISSDSVVSMSASKGDDHGNSYDFHYKDRPSSSTQAHISQSTSPSPRATNPRETSPSPPATNPRGASFARRGDNYGRRRRSPLNSGLWISIELVVIVSQIIAAIIVLYLSRHEHPQAPLFAWIIGYTAGCIATLPHLYWRYIHRNSQGSEQESAHLHQSSRNNHPESDSYTAITVTEALEGENQQTTSTISRFRQNLAAVSPRLTALVDHFKMALDCFFAVWFVVGNVWMFGGNSSASDAPNLYRLCMVFLTFSCIGYAMPFILCATICCCLPCIISIVGVREDMNRTRGAGAETINALPTYRFKSKRGQTGEESEINSDSLGEGGILAAGTDKERTISAEDAVCCICLAKYADNDELRELPCTHFFHKDCVDKWLKINALCPLCKSEIGDSAAPPSSANTGHHHDRTVGSGVDQQEIQ